MSWDSIPRIFFYKKWILIYKNKIKEHVHKFTWYTIVEPLVSIQINYCAMLFASFTDIHLKGTKTPKFAAKVRDEKCQNA